MPEANPGFNPLPTTKWWHSTVVTGAEPPAITAKTPVSSSFLLTSIWTPSDWCIERWKLSQASTFSIWNFGSDSAVMGSQIKTYDFIAYSTIITLPLNSPLPPGTEITEPFDYNDYSCQPSTQQQYYSPGVCPDKHTVAEMTVWTVTQTDSVETQYQASCCRSGMLFAATAKDYLQCISAISDPLRVLRPYTSDRTTFWEVFVYTTSSISNSVSTWSNKVDNATTITQGLAVADPIIVGWQEKELYLFPTDYASSLAQKAGIQWSPSPTPAPASTSGLPRETSPPPLTAPSLSTGGIAGLIMGVICALLIGALMIWLYLKRRKKQNESAVVTEENPTPEMEDQDQELAGRKWFLGGRWRSEVRTELEEQVRELDSRTVNVVSGPPVELDASERTRDQDG